MLTADLHSCGLMNGMQALHFQHSRAWLRGCKPIHYRLRRLAAVGSGEQPAMCSTNARSAYIHLPFCKRRCFYCDFPIQVVGSKSEGGDVPDHVLSYINTVCAEVDATGHRAKNLNTLFFGGGTPSLVHPKALELLLEKVAKVVGISSGAEISMEIDPGTFTAHSLQQYKDLGVNRFSVGVQSFNEKLLKECGRSHGLQQIVEAFDAITSVNPSSWSLDLISGLPNLDLKGWEHTLEQAIQTCPDHIAVYDLQIEKSTPFFRWYTPGSSPLPSNDAAAEMYETASSMLQQGGFEHYEVSNYAKEGHRCAHNMTYWLLEPFHAFGLGAASYLDGKRFHRPRKMQNYISWVESISREEEFDAQVPGQGQEDRLLETIMLRLRLKDGLDMVSLEYEFGQLIKDQVLSAIEKFVAKGFVEKIGLHGQLLRPKDPAAVVKIRLQDPKGFLIENDVVSEILSKVS